jgi:hypothetical protein
MTEGAIVLNWPTYLIVSVKGDAFDAAVELQKAGLEIDTVLGKTHTVMGWCTSTTKDGIVRLPVVDGWEVEE